MASLAQHPLNADYPFPTELPFPHQLVPVSEVTALSSLSKVLYESFLLDAKGGKKRDMHSPFAECETCSSVPG